MRGIYVRTKEHKDKMSEAVKQSEKHCLAVSDPTYKRKMRIGALAKRNNVKNYGISITVKPYVRIAIN